MATWSRADQTYTATGAWAGQPTVGEAFTRAIGENECSADELGLSRSEVKSLQQVTFDQLAVTSAVTAVPSAPRPSAQPRPLLRSTIAKLAMSCSG